MNNNRSMSNKKEQVVLHRTYNFSRRTSLQKFYLFFLSRGRRNREEKSFFFQYSFHDSVRYKNLVFGTQSGLYLVSFQPQRQKFLTEVSVTEAGELTFSVRVFKTSLIVPSTTHFFDFRFPTDILEGLIIYVGRVTRTFNRLSSGFWQLWVGEWESRWF